MLDNSWVGGQLVTKGTRQEDVPAELVGLVGSHLWVDEAAGANIDAATGEALTGLKDTVWIDGKSYAKGSIPPADVIPKVGTHMWVQGFAPTVSGAAAPVAPAAPPEVDEDITDETSTSEDEAANEDADAEADQGDLKPPPHSGKGSSEIAWRAYAGRVGVHVDDANDRADVIAAIEAAGKPV